MANNVCGSSIARTLAVTVCNPAVGVLINGKRWACSNLEREGIFCANPKDYGALFQFARKGDGHELRTSPRHPTDDNSNEEGVVAYSGLDAQGQVLSSHAAYGKFIKSSVSSYIWCQRPEITNWNSGTETTPAKASYDPCPTGWRVPTGAELQSLMDSGYEWGIMNGIIGGYFGSGANSIFLSAAGSRYYANGEVQGIGELGSYWCSRATLGVNPGGHNLVFQNENVFIWGSYFAYGMSVRCVAE